MKKFLTRSVQFICFAAVFYTVNMIVWERFLPDFLTPNINHKVGSVGHLNTKIKEIPSYRDVDILILGSSHANHGFDPRIFAEAGYRVFNLGSSAQTPIQTKLLLERYLEVLNPKMVLFEVHLGTFTSDGVESALDILANDNNDLLSIQMALKINNIRVYNTLIYAIFNDIFSLDQDFTEEITKGYDTYIDGGYVERLPDPNIIELDFEPRYLDLNNVRQYQFRAFQEIRSILEESDIAVVLIQAPITAERYNSYLNNAEIDSYFRELGNYYNFNELISLSDQEHFYDSHHMNQAGVEIFDQALLNILAADGFLDLKE